MEDQSILKLNKLHPAIWKDAIKAYLEAIAATPVNTHPIITETLRSFEQQAILYAQGRTKPGKIVTNSKPGQSYHQYSLAIDFALSVKGKIIWEVNENWMIVINCFKKYGFTSGLDFKIKDGPHLEKRFNKNWRELLVLYNEKHFISGTDYIDLGL